MTTEQLKYIMTIAEKKNLTKAAAALYISQSALTQFVNKLESQMGVRLFYREKNNWSPTEEGMILLDAAEQITSVYQDACQRIARLKTAHDDRIELGISIDRAISILNPVRREFSRQYPSTGINVHEGHMFHMKQMLLDKEILLGFMNEPLPPEFPDIPGLRPVYLLEESLQLIVYRGHRFYGRGPESAPVSYRDLAGENILVYGRNSVSGTLLHSLEEHSIPVNLSPNISSVRLALDDVKQGRGISFLPPLFREDPSFTGPDPLLRTVRFEPEIVWKVGVYTQADHKLTEAEQFLCELLQRSHEMEMTGPETG